MNENAKTPAWLRILLDVVMIVLAASLFSRNAVSLIYHEIAGLALAALFIAHLILNRKRLKMLFSKQEGRTARTKFIAVLDCLLVLAWLAVMVTGVLTSRRVFALRMTALDPWHDFAAAAALLLTGVHFGMNWRSFGDGLHRVLPLPKAAAAALLAVVLVFGGYSLFSARYVRWFAAPFTTQQTRGERMMRGFSEQNGDAQDGQERGGKWNRGEDGQRDGQNREGGWNRGEGGKRDGQERPDGWNRGEGGMRDGQERPDGWNRGEGGQRDGQERGGWNRGEGGKRGGQDRGGWNRGEGGQGRGGWGRGGRGQRFRLTRLLSTVASYGSILVLFAAATHGVELLAQKKKKETLATSENALQTEQPEQSEQPDSPPEE